MLTLALMCLLSEWLEEMEWPCNHSLGCQEQCTAWPWWWTFWVFFSYISLSIFSIVRISQCAYTTVTIQWFPAGKEWQGPRDAAWGHLKLTGLSRVHQMLPWECHYFFIEQVTGISCYRGTTHWGFCVKRSHGIFRCHLELRLGVQYFKIKRMSFKHSMGWQFSND